MEVRKLLLSAILPSPMNPRKTIDEEELKELAENIERQGLLQPITVRPLRSAGLYEIVCGERRFRACCLNRGNHKGPDHILAIVRNMTDDEAFDAMITENLQRKDVDPMEEAFAFGKLIEKGNTVEEVAVRFGKSTRFVRDRVKLNALIPELKEDVKKGKMPIVSALLISKVNEEDQRQFYKDNGKDCWYNKSAVDGFLARLFARIKYAIWHDKEPDFEGSCQRKCSECLKNTANHGCLFYGMDVKDDGQCTDKVAFAEKQKSYVFHMIEQESDNLVRKGEQAEVGKTVLGITVNTYDGKEYREAKEEVIARLDTLGYEVVDPDKVFKSRCWYDKTDERIPKLLDEGKIMRVLKLYERFTASIEEQYWWLSKDEQESTGVIPYEISRLVSNLNEAKRNLNSAILFEGAKALNANYEPKSGPLTEVEKKLFCADIIEISYPLKQLLKIDINAKLEDFYEYIDAHPEVFEICVRQYLKSGFESNNIPRHYTAQPIIDRIAEEWCPEAYKKAVETAKAKNTKKIAKLQKQLADKGYDENGKLIEKKSKKRNILDEYAKMKEDHPDAILLFRVGDYYECFYDDAKEVSEVLRLTLTNRKSPAGDIPLTGFPHHAIDVYLPKIIKAGKRVAICEEKR